MFFNFSLASGSLLLLLWYDCLIVAFDFRRWIQAVFCPSDAEDFSSSNHASSEVDLPRQENTESNRSSNTSKEPVKNIEVDISDGVAAAMFGISSSVDNEVKVSLIANLSIFAYYGSRNEVFCLFSLHMLSSYQWIFTFERIYRRTEVSMYVVLNNDTCFWHYFLSDNSGQS